MLEDLIAIIQRPLFGRRSNSFPGPGCEFQPGIYKTALPFGGGSVNVVNGGEGWVIPYVTQHTNALPGSISEPGLRKSYGVGLGTRLYQEAILFLDQVVNFNPVFIKQPSPSGEGP